MAVRAGIEMDFTINSLSLCVYCVARLTGLKEDSAIDFPVSQYLHIYMSRTFDSFSQSLWSPLIEPLTGTTNVKPVEPLILPLIPQCRIPPLIPGKGN